MRIPLGLCLLGLLLALAPAAHGQDAQYWDNQYGTRAQLLGGLVVGSGGDLSSTFYNPGWVAMDNQPSLLLTTRAVEYYRLKVDSGLGNDDDPVSQRLSPSPGFGAIQLKRDPERRMTIAISMLDRTNFKFEASGYRVDQVPSAADGDAFLVGEAFKVADVSDYWVGVTLAWQLSDKVAVGVTPYGALRNQSQRLQAMIQAYGTDGSFADIYYLQDTSYWHVRLLAKAGVAVELDAWTLGLALTTPSVGLFGTGTVYFNESSSGLVPEGGGEPVPYLTADRQADLSASYASPASVSIGGSRTFRQTRLHFTAEWFNSVKSKGVMDPAPFTSQSEGDVHTHDIGFAFKQVINWGLGLDHRFSDRFALYTSFRSDYSALDPNSAGELFMSNWDLWHATLGASFTWLDVEFTAGGDFTWGSGNSDRFISLTPGVGETLLESEDVVDFAYRRIKVILGLNLPF